MENPKKKKFAYYIYRPWIKVNGVIRKAKDYGKKAFKIPIYE